MPQTALEKDLGTQLLMALNCVTMELELLQLAAQLAEPQQESKLMLELVLDYPQEAAMGLDVD